MKIATRSLRAILPTGVLAAVALLLATSGSASAFGFSHAVFVQTDNPAGNQVAVYDRAPNGSLTPAGSYATGGLGGVLAGSVVDHLASQGSLTYDRADGLLFAVNAGSDTISVFAVYGDRLALRQVIGSGGEFPVSVDERNGLVYVLNAEGGGSVAGYRVTFGRLLPIPGSVRALGLDPAATPQFTHTPGEVAFTPDGSQLLVTTKENGSAVDVFRVGPFGLLSHAPVVNSLPGAVPFAVSFAGRDELVLAEAGTDALATFVLGHGGTLTQLGTAGTGQAATCWVVGSDGRFYASNAGSASLSDFALGAAGALTLFETTPTDAGTTDAAAPGDGRFLYVRAGAAGIVDAFAIEPGGTLVKVGSVTVPGAVGGEGIAAE